MRCSYESAGPRIRVPCRADSLVVGGDTARAIKVATEEFYDSAILSEGRSVREIRKNYPWHAAFFSDQASVFALKERSVVTKIGQSFVPRVAKLVALDKHDDVATNKDFVGSIDVGSLQRIDQICSQLRRVTARRERRQPSHSREMREIMRSRTGESVQRHITLDLYVGDFGDKRLFYEIKAPMPNLDQTENAKRKILQFTAMNPRMNRGYFALHYNPYGTRSNYSWPYTGTIMDMSEQVLLGAEMWDLLGGRGTFNQIIRIISQVRREKTGR